MNHTKELPETLLALALVLLAVFAPGAARAQINSDTARRGFDRGKVFAGGNIGLAFGDITYLNLSPLAGYRFSRLFAAGLQINAQYESVRSRDQYGELYSKETYSLLGAGVFARIYPVPSLFIHLQPELNFMNGHIRYYDGRGEDRYHEHVPSFLAGAGYEQQTGGSAAFDLMILYDLLQRPDSPYGDQPVIRAGVHFGF